MSFYSLPNEIHLAIIDLACPFGNVNSTSQWKTVTLVCRLWREFSQGRYLNQKVRRTKHSHFLLKAGNLSILDRSHRTNPSLWGTRDKIFFVIDSIQDVQQIWEWLATTSEWESWVKKVYLRKRQNDKLFIPGSLRELPDINLRAIAFQSGQFLNNRSMIIILRSLHKAEEITRPVLIEENSCLDSRKLDRLKNYTGGLILHKLPVQVRQSECAPAKSGNSNRPRIDQNLLGIKLQGLPEHLDVPFRSQSVGL